MNYQVQNVSDVENVGAVDRLNRMIIALTLITVAVLFTAIPAAVAFSIVVVSIYAGLTAAIGWDPLFVVVKALSQRESGQSHTSATVAKLEIQEEQPVEGDYKKAA